MRTQDHYRNDCSANLCEWTTIAVTAIAGYTNIYAAAAEPDGHYFENCPALLLQESSDDDGNGVVVRMTRVVYAAGEGDVDSPKGHLEPACDFAGYITSLPTGRAVTERFTTA